MNHYALAIDLGASSGRHVLGWLQDHQVVMEEVYRFPNRLTRVNGELCWDVEQIWFHILEGMKKCRELGKIPATVGIDGWGVDYVLLDEGGQRLGNAVSYRDSRTEGFPHWLEYVLPFSEHYARTGIAKQAYNTVYDLMFRKRVRDGSTVYLPTLLKSNRVFARLSRSQKPVRFPAAQNECVR